MTLADLYWQESIFYIVLTKKHFKLHVTKSYQVKHFYYKKSFVNAKFSKLDK